MDGFNEFLLNNWMAFAVVIGLGFLFWYLRRMEQSHAESPDEFTSKIESGVPVLVMFYSNT